MSEKMNSPCPPRTDLVDLAQAKSEADLRLWDHVAQCTTCQADLDTIEDSGDLLMQGLRFVGTAGVSDDPGGEKLDGSIDSALRRSPACQQALARALAAMSQAYWPDSQHSLPPEFGEYSIVRPLGAGGMGRVYLARHTRLNRLVALKFLSEHRELDPAAGDRFAAEMKTIGNLSHPNVVTAHDAREIDGRAVLVMEYVEGVDLSEIASQALPLAVADACSIGAQVAEGLAYAASVGIVHRDVKPSNVRIDKSGNVKLLDLGLARLTREALEAASSPVTVANTSQPVELTGTGIPVGTVDYIAPEQVTDASRVGPAADIYSLGCTLYRLLAGQSPYEQWADEGAYAKMSAHVQHTPPPISSVASGLPRPLAKLVDRMLSKSPDARPTAEEIIKELEPHTAGADLARLVSTTEAKRQLTGALPARPSDSEPQRADPQSLAEPSGSSRPPIRIALAAGLLAVLLGVLATIIITIKRPDGSETKVEVPDGSNIAITTEPDATSSVNATNEDSDKLKNPVQSESVATKRSHWPSPPWPAGAIEARKPEPLQFALVATIEHTRRVTPNRTYRGSDLVSQMALRLAKTDGSKPIGLGKYTFYSIPTDSSVHPSASVAWTGGKKFVLVEEAIGWDKINGHIQGITQESDGITLEFDDSLAAAMKEFTSQTQGRTMAIVAGGEVVVTPMLNSVISSTAKITGRFEPKFLHELQSALSDAHLASKVRSDVLKFEPLKPGDLSGVWRVVETRVRGQKIPVESAFAFKGGRVSFHSGQVEDFGEFISGDANLSDHVRFTKSGRWQGEIGKPHFGIERVIRLKQEDTCLTFIIQPVAESEVSDSSVFAKIAWRSLSRPVDESGLYYSARPWSSLDILDRESPTSLRRGSLRLSTLRAFYAAVEDYDDNRHELLRAAVVYDKDNAHKRIQTREAVIEHGENFCKKFEALGTKKLSNSVGSRTTGQLFRFKVNWTDFLEALRPVVDTAVGTDGIFSEVLKGIERDPNGPQIAPSDLIACLAPELAVMQTTEHDDSTALAIPVVELDTARNLMTRAMEKEPEALKVGSGDALIYLVVGKVKTLSISIREGHLLFGNEYACRELLKDLRRRSGPSDKGKANSASEN